MMKSKILVLEISKSSIEEPLRQIATNAGVEASVVVNAIKEQKDASFGYNARDDKYRRLS
jgi:chaperonin GroEL